MRKNSIWFFLSFACILLLVNACSNTVSSSEELENFKPEGNGSTNSSSVESSLSSSSLQGNVEDSLGMKWVSVPKAQFLRGATEVTVSPFQILETEVTQKQYAHYLDLPTQKKEGGSLPVTNVSWYDAVRFCNALSKAYGLDTNYVYSSVGTAGVLLNLKILSLDSTIRLPREAEWEIAIRAGTTTKYYWGASDKTHLYANYYSESGVMPVGSFLPNAYGLYDMAGNVSEWTEDWYSAYSGVSFEENPRGPEKGSERVFRGGSWSSSLVELASDNREKALPEEALYNRGFRIVLKK